MTLSTRPAARGATATVAWPIRLPTIVISAWIVAREAFDELDGERGTSELAAAEAAAAEPAAAAAAALLAARGAAASARCARGLILVSLLDRLPR